MNLILWRHAEAEDIAPDGTDHSRRLTKRGQQQASAIADWLNTHIADSTEIFVSPAVRTQETVAALGKQYHSDDRLSTNATINDHLLLLKEINQATVILVGHQPTLGQLAASLVCGEAQYWSIKKGAIWWLKTDSTAPSPASTKIRFVLDANQI